MTALIFSSANAERKQKMPNNRTFFDWLFRRKQKCYSFQAGIYLDDKTKLPVKGEITGILQWYERSEKYGWSYHKALELYKEEMENKYPDLKEYFWYF